MTAAATKLTAAVNSHKRMLDDPEKSGGGGIMCRILM